MNPGAISHYRIVREIGRGGMGVVYEAEDERLGRRVALKLLPEAHFDDAAARERFEREARAASALNHPHICTVHNFGEHEGRPFIVMELIDGLTLERRIAGRPLPAPEILEIGIQIADALEAAHAEGILHRDVKPQNIAITSRGDAKVLDFGLAKRVAGDAPDSTAPTHAGTQPGAALGTVGYVSPEQALGRRLDARSDLFSLGVVLYEMATGRPAFRRDTAAATFDAILHGVPEPPRERNPDLPQELARIVVRCLEKDPDLRYQHASDLRAELERLRRDTRAGAAMPSAASGPSAAETPGRPAPIAVVVGFALLGLAVFVGKSLVEKDPAAPAEPVRVAPLTTDGGAKLHARLSPAADRVAYEWWQGGPADLYVKALEPDARALRLTDHPAADSGPAWSPDGSRLAFVRWAQETNAGVLYTMPSSGGPERRLIALDGIVWNGMNGLYVPRISWSPDGSWIALGEKADEATPARIVRLDLDTLEKRALTEPPATGLGDFAPALSPDGRRLAFARTSSAFAGFDVWVQDVGGGEARRLTSGEYGFIGTPAWTTDGESLVFDVFQVGLLRVGLDGGTPQPLPGVGQDTAFPSVRRRRVVYSERGSTESDLWRVSLRGTPSESREPERLLRSVRSEDGARFSPHNRHIAFESNRGGSQNIWVCDRDGTQPRQLTRFDTHAGSARWSPNGRALVFDGVADGNLELWAIGVEGDGQRRLTREPTSETLPFWSHDGRWIYFTSDRSGRNEVWRMPAEGGPWELLTRGGGSYPQESPDGRWVYFNRGEELWRVPSAGGGETRVPRPNALPRHWVFSDGWIVYVARLESGSGPWAFRRLDPVSGAETELFRRERLEGLYQIDVSPDGEWLVYDETPGHTSELMLLENLP